MPRKFLQKVIPNENKEETTIKTATKFGKI